MNKYSFEDDELDNNDAEEIYKNTIEELKKFEDPFRYYAKLNEIVSEYDLNEDIKYISKKKCIKLIEEKQ